MVNYKYIVTPFGPAYECKDKDCGEIFAVRADLPSEVTQRFHEALKHEGPLPPYDSPQHAIELAKRMERAKSRMNLKLRRLLH